MENIIINTDNTDEEKARLARHYEKIEHMRREKKRQEKQRRMLKKLLPLGAGVLGIVLMIVAAVTKTEKKTEVNDTPMQAKQGESIEQPEAAELKEQADTTGVIEKTNAAETIEQTDAAGTTEQTNAAEPIKQADAEASIEQPEVAEGVKQTNATETIGITEGTPGDEQDISGAQAQTPVYNFETTSNTVTINSEEVISPNAILIDESTDTIIVSKEATQRISPASMTKVLTVLVAAEHITEEKLEDTFTMTLEITDYAYINDCSSVGFVDGEKVTVRDLFYGTILPSGGDAAVGLATYVAGSHEAFVDMMNEKLKELGLADSAHFTNCVGIYDENHYCTVYDMAVIMKAAMQNELCREFLSAHTYTTTPTTEHPEGITISNWFLRRIEDKDTGGEVIGAKTGYVVQSKNCAVSYGTFAGGTPYICVTAGSTSSWRCIYDHVEIYKRYVKKE